jgi:hypothetical protein
VRSLKRGKPSPSATGCRTRRYSSTSPSLVRDCAKAATPGDQVLARLALQLCDFVGQVAPCDPRLPPRCLLERLGEHDLGDVVHRCRVGIIGRGPELGHLLVRGTPHEMQAGVAQPVELAFLEDRVLRWESPAASSMPPGPGDQSVERHTHLEHELSHGASLLLCRRCPSLSLVSSRSGGGVEPLLERWARQGGVRAG